jgi:RNA polymerase sigma-70 factor (ECF subfamily)
MWLKSRRLAGEALASPFSLALEELPDALLVREAKAGNASAYGELTGRYQDKIFTFVLGQIQNREDAVDLTQEVLVKAHTHLRNFREDSLFYTWLYRIALNCCIDYRRRRNRTQDPFSLDAEGFDESGCPEPHDERVDCNPERALENKELSRYLRACIQALPEVLRTAVILHDVEGLSQKEIAEILKCPLGTVKSRIQRGRYELRDKLRPFLVGVLDDV